MGKNIVNPAGTGELDPAQSTRIPAPGAGLHERGGSPWLGREGGASSSFLLYQQLERQLAHWMPLPEAAVAPATAAAAFLDWGVHLAASPAKQWELAQYGLEQWAQAWQSALGTAAAVRPLPQDKRFDDPAWQAAPHRVLAQAFLLLQQWWQRATTGVPGVEPAPRGAWSSFARAPVAGHGGAVEFHHHQPGGAAAHASQEARPEPGAWRHAGGRRHAGARRSTSRRPAPRPSSVGRNSPSRRARWCCATG